MEHRGGRAHRSRKWLLLSVAAAIGIVLAVAALSGGSALAAGGAGGVCLLGVLAVAAGGRTERRQGRATAIVARPITFGAPAVGFQGMSHTQFQRLVCQLFEKEGYLVQAPADPGPHGVDLIVSRPGERRAVVLCRQARAQEPVQRQIVRELYESMLYEEATGGYLVTNGGFSAPAAEWAARNASLHLIDGVELALRLRQAQTQTQDVPS